MQKTVARTQSLRVRRKGADYEAAWERWARIAERLQKLWKTKKTTSRILREERR